MSRNGHAGPSTDELLVELLNGRKPRKTSPKHPPSRVLENVRWTEEEKETIVQQVFELRMRKPHLSLLKCLERTVSQMPAPRQRCVHSLTAVPWLEEKIVEKASLCQARSAELDDVKNKVAELEKQIQLLQCDIQTYEALQPTVEEVLPKAKPQELLSALGDLIFGQAATLDKTLQSINSRLQSVESALKVAPRQPASKPAVKKCRVLVVGLLHKGDENIVRQNLLDVAGRYDLVWVPAEHQGRDYPKADYAILWRKFAQHHSNQKRLQNQFGNRLILSEAGGLAGIADEIKKLVVQ